MFKNLIESSSHAREFKRRGSFVVFTAATYALLFVVAGVMSIYAYDARLDSQNTEFVRMLNPMDLPTPPDPTHNAPRPRGDIVRSTEVIRANDFVSISHPEKVPDIPSGKPNPGLPVPDSGTFRGGPVDSGPGFPDGGGTQGSGGTANSGGVALTVDVGTPPPPVPTPAPKKIINVSTVLNSRALQLPKPPYPILAKRVGAQGVVSVQVVIDETGKVISAKAVLGHPLLQIAAQQAALQARFSPTILGEHPVKVSGVITYNFVLQ